MTGDQLRDLKNRINAEMARRSRYTNVTGFAGSAWNISVQPYAGQVIVKDQGDKIITPLLQIKDYGDLYNPVANGPIPASYNSQLINYVDQLAQEPVEGTSTNCRGACTGMCFGSCSGGCKSCSGTCAGTCSGCSSSCGTGCQGGSMGSNPKP